MNWVFKWNLFFTSLILISGAFGASRAWALLSDSVFTLPPTIIEGDISENKTSDSNATNSKTSDNQTPELKINPSEPEEDSTLELKQTYPLELEQPISSTAGFGAKAMETSFNELGVPYFNMNQEEDLAFERQRDSEWLMSPQLFTSNPFGDFKSTFSSLRQIHWESAENFSVIRARIIKPNFKSSFNLNLSETLIRIPKPFHGYQVEAGVRRDRRWLEYRNLGMNAFDPQSSANIEKLQSFHDQSYFKITQMNHENDWMVDGDSVRKDVRLGSRVTGFTSIQQLGLNGRKKISSDHNFNYDVVSYLKARRGDFESLTIKNDSNLSQNRQLGAILKWRSIPSSISPSSLRPPDSIPTSTNTSTTSVTTIATPSTTSPWLVDSSLIDSSSVGSFIEVGLSHESLQREYRDRSHIQMQRYQLELIGTHQRKFSYFAIKGHLHSQGARDETRQSFQQWDSSLNQSTAQQYHDQSAEPLTLDTGMEITTLAQPESLWNLGLKSQWRRYRLLPTPTQKWGDGMSLKGNDQLPLEEGTRVAAGVWFEQQGFQAELLPFYEQTKNEPVILAVSPQAAKTLGLGSVYARGVELHLRQELSKWSIDFIYSYQEAVNNSRISWQRGHALPGRPTHSIQSSLVYGQATQGFNFGMNYGYKSEEALDLSGLWRRTPHHDLKSFLGYGTRTWTVQLIGAQLLSTLNDSPMSLQQGMAGYDLMDPKIETKEYQLLCEFFL